MQNMWKTKEELIESLDRYAIPAYMYDGIARYVFDGLPPGGFLTSVFENDLYLSVARADDTNRKYLIEYVRWLYNEAPHEIYGERGVVKQYCSQVAMGASHAS